MRRHLLLLPLFLAAPVMAQDGPTPAQLEKQRALLQRFGMRLSAWNEQYQLFDQLRNLTSPDQEAALKSIKFTPAQRNAIFSAIQAAAAGGNTTDAKKALIGAIGMDMSDNLLELVPSPQQLARADAIFKAASAGPLGQSVFQAASDLSASLSPAQHTWLDPILSRIKAPDAGAPPAAPPVRPKLSGPKPVIERRLVMMRSNSLGDVYAEIRPDFDYCVATSRTYRIEGADPSVLAGVANSQGLPVRLAGTYTEDVVTVPAGFSLGPLPIQPVTNADTVWRGRLPATVVTANPAVVTLDAGRGQTITANLDFQTPNEQKAFQAAGQTFLLHGTCMVTNGNATMVDMDFAPYTPPNAAFSARLLVQISEEFMDHVAGEFRAGHPKWFSYGDSTGLNSVQVTDLGATMQGCTGPQVKLFGRGGATVGGLQVLEAEVEGITAATFAKGNVNLTLVPGSMQARLLFPLYLQIPSSWIDNVTRILSIDTTQPVSFAIPAEMQTKLTTYGLIDPGGLDRAQLFSNASGDRRTSFLTLAAPGNTTASSNMLATRLLAPGEFAGALSDEAINSAINKTLPPMMPLKVPIPAQYQKQGGVTLEQLEFPALDISFANGEIAINNCEIHVHWSYGLFSGVEPGCKLKGTARVFGSGNPFQLKMRLNVKDSDLQIISPRLLGGSAEELASTKASLLKAMNDNDLPIATVNPFPFTVISPRAALQPTDARGTASPSDMLLRGSLTP